VIRGCTLWRRGCIGRNYIWTLNWTKWRNNRYFSVVTWHLQSWMIWRRGWSAEGKDILSKGYMSGGEGAICF
jgi:hypothetical protein